VKTSPIIFYKNIQNLNIQIKNYLSSSINFKTKKIFHLNKYLNIKINSKILVTLDFYLRIIKNRILHLIKKYNLNKIE
jgi:hypothetical protein